MAQSTAMHPASGIGSTPTGDAETTSTMARSRFQPATPNRRTVTVWASLIGAMTLSAGLMGLLQQGPRAAGASGVSLTPLVAQGVASGASEIVLNPEAELDRERWRGITIHHSGFSYDDPERLDARHRAMNLRGLGYHFVIGNGKGMGDGELHIGRRWLEQLPGAHATGPEADWHNRHSIAICLVGDGDRGQFTERQLARLEQLVGALGGELSLASGDVRLHRDIAGVSSPGRFFPESRFRERIASAR
ncbi:MAG: peptidoglycan recognition family protein [Planctomycetota bacterium]